MLIVTTVGNVNVTKMWCIWDSNDEHELKLMRNWIKIGETGDDVDDIGAFGWIKSRGRLVAIIRPMTDD